MKVYLVMDRILGGLPKVCKTKEIAEIEIQKEIDYYTSPDSKYIAKRERYYIKEVKVISKI